MFFKDDMAQQLKQLT